MKKYYLASLFLFLIISCSKDNPIIKIEEEEEEVVVNLPPSDFDISINSLTDSSVIIKWSAAIDPENNPVSYAIYLNKTLVSNDITDLKYEFTDLSELTSYSGKVVAKDSLNNKTEKDFSFTTKKYFLKYAKTFDFENDPGGDTYSMVKTKSGNYVIIGSEPRADYNGRQLFVLKIDYYGNKIWKKHYDFQIGDARTFKFIQSLDNGFIFVAGKNVIKTDNQGELIWHREILTYITEVGPSEIKSVKEDINGFIYVVGGRNKIIYAEKSIVEAVLTKLDPMGNVLWEKTYGTSARSFFDDIAITNMGDILILGSTETSGGLPEQIDFWVIKTDLDGNIVWEQTYGDGKYDFPGQIIKTNDGNFVFVGFSWGAYDVSDARLFKIDINGNVIWNSTYTPNDLRMFSVVETIDGGFASVGYNFGYYRNSVVILKYDNTGSFIWEKLHYKHDRESVGYAILQTEDKGYIINSLMSEYGSNGYPGGIWILKTDPEGNFE